jgi:hypothetical protein
MTHFTDAELIRWSESGAGEDRDRVVAHVAECSACAARYAAAIRTRTLEAGDAALDAGDLRPFVEAGVRVGAAPARVLPMRWSALRIAAALSAAAGIVLTVFVARNQLTPARERTPVFRGGTLIPVAPSGETTVDARVEWEGGVVAPRYRITVGGPSGAIYTFIVRNSPAPFPAELRSMLGPGTEYWWTVAALDTENHMVLVTERQPFTIRAR